MRYLAYVVCFCLLMCSFSSQAEIVNEINIKIGEMKTIYLNKIEKIAIANSDILGYQILNENEVFIIPKKKGKTEIQVWSVGDHIHKYVVYVDEETIENEFKLVRELTRDISGLEVKIVKNKIVFSGLIKKEDEHNYSKIIKLSQNFVDLVKVNPFQIEQMIKIHVQIVEISKKAIEQLGIRWNQSAAGPAIGIVENARVNPYFAVASQDAQGLSQQLISSIPLNDKSFFGYAGISSALGSQLDLLSESGEAKILAKPELVTRHGEKASFHSGGQFPIQKTSSLGQVEIEYVPYGIRLDIEPFIDQNSNIKSTIFAEISNIDPSMQINTVPAFLTRKVETVINAKNNQTMVISGLTSVDSSTQESKLPYFSDIPVVGKALFKSKQTVKKENEVVIFVTPYVVNQDQKNENNNYHHDRDTHRDGNLGHAGAEQVLNRRMNKSQINLID